MWQVNDVQLCGRAWKNMCKNTRELIKMQPHEKRPSAVNVRSPALLIIKPVDTRPRVKHNHRDLGDQWEVPDPGGLSPGNPTSEDNQSSGTNQADSLRKTSQLVLKREFSLVHWGMWTRAGRGGRLLMGSQGIGGGRSQALVAYS